MQCDNFINNAFVPSAKYISKPLPASNGEILFVADSDAAAVDTAVRAANLAFVSWSKTTHGFRSKLLFKIADLLEEKLEDFAKAESKDQGKPLSLARSVDIPRAIHNFRFFASYILHLSTDSSQLDGVALNYVHSYPVGVAGLISPWNLPLYLLTWKIAYVHNNGCTCVCKPSEFTSLTGYMLCSVIKQAGVPPGVVNMVFGTGNVAGNALVVHPEVPLISFTGGTKTGEVIYRNSAPFFKKLSLELGGKNANIIFADCDLEAAVTTSVRSSFSNQGEICLCGSRIYVQRQIYDSFLYSFKQQVSKLVVGDPMDPKTNIGALVSSQHLEKVLSYVDLARKEGAIVFGGTRLDLPGYFMTPAIITDIKLDSRVCREEIFGPVVTLHPFDTENEVVRLANDSEYGLSASVWTTNLGCANRISRALLVGTVWVNCWMVRDLNMPFGGTKKSGLGREGGKYSREFFCEEK
ncbi:Aldehyde dehydrogenase 8 member A1, partial [Nowakowskiella sp. JEL0078]